jgi:LacI family transcriptional regulator
MEKRVSVPVSIREVAAHAGVSVATVSNVLNRPDIVARPTRDRVNASIRELGFVRNESARQLRAGRSRTIGLVVLDVANPFFTDLARGVEDEASKAGLAVILCNSDDQERKEKRYLELLEEHRVQGVLITPVVGAGSRLARLQRRGTPVVLVDSRSPSRGQCSVAVDDVLGGDLAVTHLLDTGHQHIAYISGPRTIRQVADRYDGALRALDRAGRRREDLHVLDVGSLNVAAGQKAGADIAAMRAADRPTAVFCTNDLIALGVLQEMTRHKIRVPEDISIVGYDDIDFAAAAAVPLTSVRQPRQQLGRTAARMLLEEAEAGEAHQHQQVIFEPELIVRQSTKASPAGRRAAPPRRLPPAGRRALPHELGQREAAGVGTGGIGHPPGDPGVGDAVPRVGDADAAARPVVAERLVAAVGGPVVGLLEHDAEAGREPEHEVLAYGLDLRDPRDRVVVQQRREPVDLADAHRVKAGEAARRPHARGGGLPGVPDGADVRQQFGWRGHGGVERHAGDAVRKRGRRPALPRLLLRRGAGRQEHAHPVIDVLGSADVEVDAARIADLLAEELGDGDFRDAPDQLVHDGADRQPVIPVRLAGPPVRDLRGEPGRHRVVVEELLLRELRLDAGQARLVRQRHADRDLALAAGGELGPVTADRGV